MPRDPAGPIYVVTLQARPGIGDGVRGLKYLLKVLLRHHGFVCLGVEERHAEPEARAG